MVCILYLSVLKYTKPLCFMHRPVISLTVRNTSSFLASRGGIFLKSSLCVKTNINPLTVYDTVKWDSSGRPDNYPRIPVTRKWRLPWILVQLMKLSMLLESTVCLCSAPVPSHTAGMTEEHHSFWPLTNRVNVSSWKVFMSVVCRPFGQSPVQSSHCLWPSLSTSVLSGGQTLTQELPSTTKWAKRRKRSEKEHVFQTDEKNPLALLTKLRAWVTVSDFLQHTERTNQPSHREYLLGHWETQMDPYWYFALGLVSIWNVCLL